IGLRKILLIVLTIGTFCFLSAAIFEASIIALFITFTLAGVFVGSLYSLGISYMTDLLPSSLLPAGNLLVAITFSIGSISGPFVGGLFIELFPGVSFFYIIVCMLVIILAATFLKGRQTKKDGFVP